MLCEGIFIRNNAAPNIQLEFIINSRIIFLRVPSQHCQNLYLLSLASLLCSVLLRSSPHSEAKAAKSGVEFNSESFANCSSVVGVCRLFSGGDGRKVITQIISGHFGV